ncbi:uncharacterized protein EMH_0060940 [Eimeria mitis]|uniref:Uncharacterized protein n=1 Tax=Eimeria mitis TaxID=44415 RepID=U6K165_9EIME|nr:uncharacterized protein EMH_0060940 [Eimeria mitis]CDJ30731.1 hypothetical protein EMH_0060940 [Eimeria mitis]
MLLLNKKYLSYEGCSRRSQRKTPKMKKYIYAVFEPTFSISRGLTPIAFSYYCSSSPPVSLQQQNIGELDEQQLYASCVYTSTQGMQWAEQRGCMNKLLQVLLQQQAVQQAQQQVLQQLLPRKTQQQQQQQDQQQQDQEQQEQQQQQQQQGGGEMQHNKKK